MLLDPVTSVHVYQHETITSGIIMTILTTLAVTLRLYSKRMTREKFGLDDWFIITSQVMWYVQYGLQLHSILEGRQATSVTDPHFKAYLKYLYIYGDFYAVCVCITNLSILAFYWRIFSVDATFRLLAMLLVGLQILWFIPTFLVEALLCAPVHSFWTDPAAIPTKCVYYSTFWIVTMSSETLLDAMILGLSVMWVAKLKLSWQKKFMVSSIFLLGGFVIITNIVRITKSFEPGNQLIDLMLDIFWLDIHVGTSIICACLPTYRPIITKGISSISGSFQKYYGSSFKTGSGASASNPNNSSSKHNDTSGISSNSRDYKNYSKFSRDAILLVRVEKDQRGELTPYTPNSDMIKQLANVV